MQIRMSPMAYKCATSLVIFVGCLLMPLTCAASQKHNRADLPPAYNHLRPPFNPSLPTIYVVGDSTASFHSDPTHEDYAGAQGWGVFLNVFFNPDKVNVVNAARGGRSTRTYMTQGLWKEVVQRLKPNDIVLIQLGQNDVFPINDTTRARGTFPGIGPESKRIHNLLTGKYEVVHTFGWYLKRYIKDTRAKGAIPVVLSLTPPDIWQDGDVRVSVRHYRKWIYQVAMQENHTLFVDAGALIARQYDELGQAKTFGLYFNREPIHVDIPGAFMNASIIVAGLKGLPNSPINKYLSYFGKEVVPCPGPVLPKAWSIGQNEQVHAK